LRRKECCVDWITSEESDEFLVRVITDDELWIYEYDVKLKSQSRERKQKDSPRLKKSRKSKSKIKVMLMVFFDCHGIVHHEFTPEGQIVNAAFYVEVLKRLIVCVACDRNCGRGGDGFSITTMPPRTLH